MRNTLVTESDVTSGMMGEMYRQLTSAQLRGKLYKTGYRRAKTTVKEAQGSTAAPATVVNITPNVTIPPGTPGPLIPGTPQLRTPPRPMRMVASIAKTPTPTHTTNVTTVGSPVPQTPLINIS